MVRRVGVGPRFARDEDDDSGESARDGRGRRPTQPFAQKQTRHEGGGERRGGDEQEEVGDGDPFGGDDEAVVARGEGRRSRL